MNHAELGLHIQTLRKRKGLSLRELAKSMGVNYQRLQYIENPKGLLRPSTLTQVARGLSENDEEFGILQAELMVFARYSETKEESVTPGMKRICELLRSMGDEDRQVAEKTIEHLLEAFTTTGKRL